jgi:hypothetical protein
LAVLTARQTRVKIAMSCKSKTCRIPFERNVFHRQKMAQSWGCGIFDGLVFGVKGFEMFGILSQKDNVFVQYWRIFSLFFSLHEQYSSKDLRQFERLAMDLGGMQRPR